MTEEFDFGINFDDDETVVEASIHQTAVERAEDLDKALRDVYHMIRPLLVKLTDNPDKTTMRWPGRAEQATQFLSKLDKRVGEVIDISQKKVNE